jgi:Sulfotransferase family
MTPRVAYANLHSRLLLRHAFEVQFVIPLVSAPAPVERLLGWYESTILRVDTSKIGIDRPIFLTGVPRSGTTMLQDILTAHPNVAYITNTMHQFRKSFCAAEVWRKRLHLQACAERYIGDGVEIEPGSANEGHAFLAEWRHIDPYSLEYVELDPADLSSTEVTRLREVVRKIIWCFGPGQWRFFNKNPALITYLPVIHSIFPDAKIIHLVRDARECAYSMIKLFQRHRNQECRIRARYPHASRQPGWFIPYPRVAKLARYIAEYGPEDIRTTSHVWDDAVSAVAAAAPSLNQFYEVRYEDIVARPHAEIRKILEFCDLPSADGDQQRFWRRVGSIEDRRHMRAYGDAEIVEDICHANLTRYGYL